VDNFMGQSETQVLCEGKTTFKINFTLKGFHFLQCLISPRSSLPNYVHKNLHVKFQTLRIQKCPTTSQFKYFFILTPFVGFFEQFYSGQASKTDLF
jgi:hypothetical protein